MDGHSYGWQGKTLEGYHQWTCNRCGDLRYADREMADGGKAVREPVIRQSRPRKGVITEAEK
jgi:hypothetical protein